MSFPRYPEYKDSGVEWLGEVPAHWKPSALKHLARYQNGYPFKPEDWSDIGLPIIRISQLTGEEESNYFSGEVDRRNYVSSGDLLFSWSATIDSFIWNRGDAWLNQHIFRVSVTDEATKEYLYYLIKFIAPKLADVDAHGSTMRHIKKESLSQVVVVPPLAEQAAIANFLDAEVYKVDRLIAEQESLIALLKEKRQAVISHAVTKGLDPNVPIKDSGIEWLGEVPAHWQVLPIKALARLAGRIGYRGYTTQDLVDEGEGAISLSPSNLINGNVVLESCTYISWEKYEESPEIQLACGDVVMVKTGSTYGKVAFFGVKNIPPTTINPQLVILKDFRGDSQFLCFALCAAHVVAEIDVSNSGGTIPTMSQESIGNFRIPIPPLREMKEIADFVCGRIRSLDLLSSEAEGAVTLLRERRSTLISAAVTGKIDVRQIKATEAA